MIEAEAKDVIKILLEADNGHCPYCSADLIRKFIEQFPQYKGIAETEFYSKFPGGESPWNKRIDLYNS